MQKVTSEESPQCQKCDSNKWIISRQGDTTCQLCGFVFSQGYISYEDEVYQDLENKKVLSRISIAGGELNINKFDNKVYKKFNQVEDHVYLFNECIKVFDFFNPKEVYLERNIFLDSWNAESEGGDKSKADTKRFVYNYCINEWRGFFNIDYYQNFLQTLKKTLKIKESEIIKEQPINNRPTSDEKFYQLIKNLYPKLTEVEYAICSNRLENVQYSVNCNRMTSFCVTAFDLLLNFFHQKKVDIDEIVKKAHQIFLYEKSQLKSTTVKRVHKQYLKQISKDNNSTVYSQ